MVASGGILPAAVISGIPGTHALDTAIRRAKTRPCRSADRVYRESRGNCLMSVSLETRYLESFVRPHELGALQPQVTAAHELLHAGSGLGSDFLGWLTLPTDYDKEEFARIQAAAARIRQDTDIFIAIGIGGSYLGARAAIEFLKSPLYNAKKKDTPDVLSLIHI